MALLQLADLHKTYGTQPAVRNISLELQQGEILSLLGPSGCGKTTLLRMVAGLEVPDAGQVLFNGRDVTRTPVHQRRFGLMFQEFALFPHKSVFDNVAFGLSLQPLSTSAVRDRTMDMLDLVGMAAMASRNVADLSGGERQRVALARSLAPRPRLLMLDEPLGALDRALRERLLAEIRSILKAMDMTAIFVTHDQSEALGVADQIAVMHQGRLEQMDPPETLYLHPRSRFTAQFLGFRNLLRGTVDSRGQIATVLGRFPPPPGEARPGDPVTLVLRPEGARLASSRPDDESSAGPLPAIGGLVVGRLFTGQTYRVKLESRDHTELTFDLPNGKPPPMVGQSIALTLDPGSLVVIKENH